MGAAEVVAIDEVKKYVECLQFLKKSFAIDNLEPRHLSLYDLVDPAFQDRFDLVLFAGVLYHVTDPIVALRITFNCLRDGGMSPPDLLSPMLAGSGTGSISLPLPFTR
jgi:2-polyprenyl-3-methyl-5-hydroxy-6-metoxy-1,4-benzoquinol methylase